MFFDALDHVRRGLVVCVFDGPDRIQLMFWRFIDQGHPALADRPNTHASSIREMYQKMDQLVGETHERMGPDTALIVMSDHGFKPFRRGVDLNRWLLDNDYLCLKDGATTSTNAYLADVDWQQTRAFALGLSGLFINQQGREAQGIVPAGQQKDQLVAEIARRLTGLVDPEQGTVAIHEAVARERAYQGPYVEGAPDIIAGYNVGYRVSWESAVGNASLRRSGKSGHFRSRRDQRPAPDAGRVFQYHQRRRRGRAPNLRFFHRDPRPEGKSAIRIYFSSSDMHSTGAARGLSLGKWRIPISGGEAPQLLRQGQAFWQPLVEQGAAAKVFFLPSNYPVQGATGPGELETISGMGTPDLRGGLGEFTFVTPQAPLRGRQVTGGKLVYANLWGASHRYPRLGSNQQPSASACLNTCCHFR